MNILIAESTGFPPAAAERLRQSGNVVLAELDRPALETAVVDADVLWVRLRNRIDAALLMRAPQLKIIATPTTGLSHIDLQAAAANGIQVLSLRGAADFLRTIRGTAEHTIGLMLALLRRLPAAVKHVEAGGWDRTPFRGEELYGRTVGIVGYGRLGRIVARYLHAFEARVLMADYPDWSGEIDPWVKRVPLEELLAASDIVSLHVNLTPRNEKMIGPKEFAAMKAGAFFVNTARGELIDEAALEEALASRHLAGAALDVIAGEPLARPEQHRLIRYAQEHDTLLLTPHIGGCTRESMERTELYLAERLAEIASGYRENQ
jgi:D-3-phosphoglycerate dehydrogenase / 2-oxoglutarate reductase